MTMNVSFGERILYGVVSCTLLSVFLALLATLGFLLDPAESLFSSLGEILGTYVGGGIVAGLIVGVGSRWVGNRWSAVVLGIIAMGPVAVLAGRGPLGPLSTWGSSDFIICGFVAVVFGGILGYGFYPKVLAEFAALYPDDEAGTTIRRTPTPASSGRTTKEGSCQSSSRNLTR